MSALYLADAKKVVASLNEVVKECHAVSANTAATIPEPSLAVFECVSCARV